MKNRQKTMLKTRLGSTSQQRASETLE
jgi:hypothetical protein